MKKMMTMTNTNIGPDTMSIGKLCQRQQIQQEQQYIQQDKGVVFAATSNRRTRWSISSAGETKPCCQPVRQDSRDLDAIDIIKEKQQQVQNIKFNSTDTKTRVTPQNGDIVGILKNSNHSIRSTDDDKKSTSSSSSQTEQKRKQIRFAPTTKMSNMSSSSQGLLLQDLSQVLRILEEWDEEFGDDSNDGAYDKCVRSILQKIERLQTKMEEIQQT